jgi:hypothetical protein
MRLPRLLPVVLTLAWGLWFGGVITLFLAVTSLFDTFKPDRALAGTAAAGIFRRFEFYQLVLAAVAVSAAALLRASRHAALGRRTLLLVLLALAAGTALTSTLVVSSRIEHLRQSRLTDTPEFRRLHGLSMAVYLAEAGLLLAAGLALPGALGFNADRGMRPPPDSTVTDA